MRQMKPGFRIAARGLVVKDNRLLFVSNEGHYWYLPGGGVEENEDLCTCVEREIFEETGLKVRTGKLLYVLESFDLKDNVHKINFYFQTTLISGDISDNWSDTDNCVQFRRYFGLEEIQAKNTFIPHFLKDGKWLQACSGISLDQSNEDIEEKDEVYQGCLTVHGFELVDV